MDFSGDCRKDLCKTCVSGDVCRFRSILSPTPKCIHYNNEKLVVGIHCPLCGWHQVVPAKDWLFQRTEGHGYTCGSGKCPSHTYMVLDLEFTEWQLNHILSFLRSRHSDGCATCREIQEIIRWRMKE